MGCNYLQAMSLTIERQLHGQAPAGSVHRVMECHMESIALGGHLIPVHMVAVS